MNYLQKALILLRLLTGRYDGRHFTPYKQDFRSYLAVCSMFAFESIKQGTLAITSNSQLYMYLGQMHFSGGQLKKLSSPILFVFSFGKVNFEILFVHSLH